MSLFDTPRKRNIALAAAGSLFAAGLGTFLYAAYFGNRKYKLEGVNVITGGGTTPEAERETAEIASGIRGGHHGDKRPLRLVTKPDSTDSMRLKILHISDLHLSQPESHKIDFVRRVTDDEYDLVILTGDVFENYSGVQYADALLSRKPRLGAYAVLGNHDYYEYTYFHKTVGRVLRKYRHPSEFRNVEPMVRALEKSGFTVLRNECVTHTDERLHIIGIDYPGIAASQMRRLADKAPAGHMIISLQHVPHRLAYLSDYGVDLAFAGHTHGGQVRIPGIGALVTDCELHRSEASGIINRNNTLIHISRGLGADPKSNFRLFCPPHATILNVQHHF